MEIKKAVQEDLPELLAIYDGARQFMRQSGNMDQWTNGYPGEDIILEDIRNGSSYICTDDGAVVGVFSLIMGEDPTYRKIYEGRWLNDNPYGTIHRIAVRARNRGVAFFCLERCFKMCGNVRVDTHRDNAPMQKLLLRNGYAYCGIIHLADGSERLAYQKTV